MMFPSTAASHSSSGIFGSQPLFGSPTGMANYGGTSTSSSTLSTLVNGEQGRGSRIAVYKRTAEVASSAEKLISISAMPAYKAKSHEELRWEDYNLTGKGGFGLSSSAVKSTSHATNFPTASWGTTTLISSTTMKPNPFGRTLPSVATQTTTWQYPGPTSTSFTSQPLQFSTSASTCLTTHSTHSFNPFNSSNSFNPSAPSSSLSPFNSFNPSDRSSSFNPFNSINPSAPSSSFNPSTLSSSCNPSTPSGSFNPFNSINPSAPSSSFNPSTLSSSFNPSAPAGSFNPFQPFTSSNPFAPSSSCNSFIPRTNLTSPASTTVSAAPLNLFNSSVPGTTLTSTSSTASSISLAPLNQNPFANSSTSLATHTSSSCPSFAAFTGVVDSAPSSLNAFWSTPIRGPFVSTETAAANSIVVSPVNSGLSSSFDQPTTFINPGVSPAQNRNGPTTGFIGQSDVSQLSSSQIARMEEPSSAASPFGTLPPIPRMFFDGSHSKQSIQYGISSMTVKDKPAPVKYSLLTTRHLSGRIKLPVRKYDPKLNAPKKPYFIDTKEILVAAYVPRENPRALVVGPEKWPPRAIVENIHGEKVSSSTYENKIDDPSIEKQLFTSILDVPSKLQQPDYYTQPHISELEAKEQAEPGYCTRVKDFVIGRHGYGSIKFLGETDIRKVDIETHVQFNNREVIVYMDDSKKPPVGEGLNKPAEITLLNIKCMDKKTGIQCMDGSMVNKYTEMLKRKTMAQGAEFVSYDPVQGEWKFRVQHF